MTSITGPLKPLEDYNGSGNRGITLLELILVLAILCILTGIIAPHMSGFAEGRRFVSEWNHLQDMVRYARSEAIARSVTVEIGFNQEEGTYGITKNNSGLKNLPVEFTTHNLPNKLAFDFPDSATREDNRIAIRFLPDGTVDEDSPEKIELAEQGGDFIRILKQDPLLGYVVTTEDDTENDETTDKNS